MVQETREFEFIIPVSKDCLGHWEIFKMNVLLSIENLCFVIRELLNNATIPSGVYQVADDESLSTNKLIVSGSLNKKNRVLKFLIYKKKVN
jgi:hypothetical protein